MSTRLLSAFIWFWIFIIPLTFNFWALDPALYSKFLLLDISLLAAGAILLIKNSGGFMIDRSTLQFLLSYGIYILLSVISLVHYSINPADGWFIWLHLFTIPTFVLILLLIDSRVSIDRYQVSFAISSLAGVAIVIGIVQYLLQIDSSGWYLAASDVMRSTFAHKNIFSEVLLLTLPFSVYAGFGKDRKRLLPIVISILTLFTILMLLSRAVWLGLIVASIVTIVIYYWANRKLKWYHLIGFLLSIGLCYVFYKWFIRNTNTGDYLAYFYSKRDTINERKHLWSATWQIIRLHSIIGSGIGSWKVLNMRYGIVGLRDYATFFQQPHNDYLWILSEQGIAGLIAVAAAWGLIVYRLIRQLFSKPSDWFSYCLLFALAGYGVYANMAFPRERAEHSIILAFVAFFVLSSESKKNISFPRFILWPVCFVLASCVWWSANKMINEIHLKKFFEARSRNDVAEQREQLQGISSTYYTLDGTATPIAWYSGMLNFSQGNITSASADFDEAVKANPYHAYSLSNVGTCLNIKGDKNGAEKYFVLALEYSPGFPDAALNLCALKFNEGKIDSAAKYLGMVNDSIGNIRYGKSLNAVSQVVIKSILDSLKDSDDGVLRQKVTTLSKKTDWQAEIFKKAYIYHRTIKKQMLMDMIWSIENDDHDTTRAAEYQRKLIH